VCGIAGIIGADVERDPSLIERMVAALKHRGPDAQTVTRLEGCHLGHARLSIIDLGTGDQPMRSADGRFWIVFNGEIYNYRELRAELARLGHEFRTKSDTEVILAAYAQWGRACLLKLRGMYALAIWEPASRQLFAARDPFGEKPFFFLSRGETLIFASEIKALPRTERGELNELALDRYLAFGYVPPDLTIWNNVRALKPGHFLAWTAGRPHEECFWQPRFGSSTLDADSASERLTELLQQAVRRQLVADVPVGAFLSGGHDSSTVVALMSGALDSPARTFSVGFGPLINELPYAREVATAYATDHHEVDLGEPPVGELLAEMSRVYDEPFADSSAIPTYLIARFAREHVKVVLSGDGGDELFGGYGWYTAIHEAAELGGSHAKWSLLRLASKALGDRNPALLGRAYAAGLAARWPDPWLQCVMSETYFRSGERARLWQLETPPTGDTPDAGFKPDSGTQGLDRAFFFDVESYLPGDILVKVDRASMAHGLECRAPLLDLDLAEFALSLPASSKVTSSGKKIVLRKAAEHLWPPAIRTRPKLGFGAPYGKWLSRPDVRELLRRVFARGSRLRTLLPGVAASDATARSYKTWILLTLGLWLEQAE
jgi:asparagine synthase (glutamine-hydrolysing)